MSFLDLSFSVLLTSSDVPSPFVVMISFLLYLFIFSPCNVLDIKQRISRVSFLDLSLVLTSLDVPSLTVISVSFLLHRLFSGDLDTR